MAQLDCPECGSDKVRRTPSNTSGCDLLFAVLIGIPMILLGWLNEWWLLVFAGILFTLMGLVSLTYGAPSESLDWLMECADCGHKWIVNEREYQEIASRPS